MELPFFIWMMIIPLCASPIVYLIGRLGALKDRAWISQWVGLTALVLTWVPFVQAAIQLNAKDRLIFSYGKIFFVADGLSLVLAGVALVLGTLVVIFSGSYIRLEEGQEKYYAMLVAMVGAMIGLGCVNDLFNLWVWFEAMAISSYLLVAFYRQNPLSLEAGIKYLVMSAAGSVLVLIGIGLVFSQSGTLKFSDIRALATYSPSLLMAGACFIIGFGVKSALVPMHTWLPDAHSQAPSGISAMLSGIVIEAGLVALLRSLFVIGWANSIWGPLLMAFGAVNMLVGNLMALRQTQVKRLLAYSSIAHIGYILVGIGIGMYSGNAGGAQGGFFHLINHGMMKGLAFLSAGAWLYVLHISTGNHEPLKIEDLSGASRRYPFVAVTFSLAVLGLGGIPPLSGFMSKWQILVAGFQTQNIYIDLLALFTAFNSILSLAYYVPLVNTIYKKKTSPAVEKGTHLPSLMYAPLALLGIGILVLGIWPNLADWLTSPAGSIILLGH